MGVHSPAFSMARTCRAMARPSTGRLRDVEQDQVGAALLEQSQGSLIVFRTERCGTKVLDVLPEHCKVGTAVMDNEYFHGGAASDYSSSLTAMTGEENHGSRRRWPWQGLLRKILCR